MDAGAHNIDHACMIALFINIYKL